MRSGGPAGTAIQLERLREPLVQELSELGCRLELGNRLELLERRREGTREAPDRPRLEFLVLRLEIQLMYGPCQMLGSFQLAFHESFVDYDFGSDIGEFTALPSFDLLFHRPEVSLHSVNTD